MTMTNTAINKALEVLEKQDPKPMGLRVGIIGGGCSGFQYNMSFESNMLPLDKKLEFKGKDGKKLTVLVDQASLLYLNNCEIDYVESLEMSGFKFNNPDTKSTCGCGSSFTP